jgi:hypothetical protein
MGFFCGWDGEGRERTYGFAELAGNAALFTRGVSTEGVFTAEPRRDGTLLEGEEVSNQHQQHHHIAGGTCSMRTFSNG